MVLVVLSNRGSGDGDTVLVISYGITALSGFWRPEGSMPGYLTSGRSSFLCMVPLDSLSRQVYTEQNGKQAIQ